MNKNASLGIITSVFLLVFSFFLGTKGTLYFASQDKTRQESSDLFPSAQAATGSKEAFDYLSENTNSFCGMTPQTVDSYSDNQNIQGACCGEMDFHRYQEQAEGLKKYSDISQIPEDPYNIPVSLAKELFGYQKSIVLTEKQQKIYDKAMAISAEGGPCCCRCWRFTAFEGQAKYLITKHNFKAEQIAYVWDLEDGCGGADHVGGNH